MSETQLKDAISNSAAGKAPAAALFYDPKQVGESKTSPHVRMTAFNEVHCQMLVSAFTAARGSCGSVQVGDLVALFDGFRPGLSNKFGRVFVDENSRKVKNHASSLLMVYSQTQLMGVWLTKTTHEFVSNCMGVIGGPHWDHKAKTRSLQGALWPNG